VTDNSIVQLIWALAGLAVPVCILVIAILFRKDISLLLARIGKDKFLSKSAEIKSQKDKETRPVEKEITIQQGKHDTNTCNDGKRNFSNHENDESIFELCKNNNSGKYFIIIEEIEDDKAIMIIPTGEIKELELKLFSDPKLKDVNKLYRDNLLTEAQVETLKRITVEADSFIDDFIARKTTPKQTDISLEAEPPYIKSYRKMLKNDDTFPSRMLKCIDQEESVDCSRLKKILSENYGYLSKTSGSFSASLRVLLVDGYINISGRGDDKIISIKR